tara:strand:+ start:2327 stop:2740 length:414 start_codon:yes stop_codon:yes gene_type:complete
VKKKIAAIALLLSIPVTACAQSQGELPPQRAGVSDGPAMQPFPGSSVTMRPQWSYRVRGTDALKPASVRDDGEKTYIRFAPDQLLPAIFAISPTGDETLTNGYMRGEEFVLDRVWQELVFRIDGKKATARRNEQPDG